MEQITTIGLDIAKHVFHAWRGRARASGVQPQARPVEAAGFLRPAAALFGGAGGVCRVALLGPRASRLGHEVRLIPPAYVKPFDGKRTFEKSLSTTALIGAAA